MYGSLAGSESFFNLYKDKDIIPMIFFVFKKGTKAARQG